MRFQGMVLTAFMLASLASSWASTGGTTQHVWTMGGQVNSSPAIGTNGTIYVGSYDNNLYAFNPDGTTQHVWTTGGMIHSSPAIGTDGTIYVGSGDNNLYAFNPDGTTCRVWNTGAPIYSSPAIGADGTVYAGSTNNNLYAFNPDGTTQHVWNVFEGMYAQSPVIGSEGTIYIGSGDASSGGYLCAYNPDGTTQRVWKMKYGITWDATPAIGSDGTIYIWSLLYWGGGCLHAYNPNGTTQYTWNVSGGLYENSPAIGSNGTIYIGSGSKVYAFNPNGTTNHVWTMSMGGGFSSPAIGSDGTIYVGYGYSSIYGSLYAFNADGTTNRVWNTGRQVLSSPAIGTNGTIYVGSQDGNFYAFDGTGGVLATNSPWPKFRQNLQNTGRGSYDSGGDSDGSVSRCISGDYDGDGKTDLAVFQRSTAMWFIFSLTKGLLVNGVSWGDVEFVYDTTGMLVGYRWNGSQEEIVAIDPSTGASSVIATLDLAWVTTGSFVVDSSGNKAYLLGQKGDESFWRIFAVDLLTGASSSVPLWDMGSSGFGFDWYQNNMLIGYRWNGFQEEIITIDPSTGETSVIATLDLTWVTTGSFAVDSADDRAYLLGQKSSESFWRIFSIALLSGKNSSVQLANMGSGGFGFDSYQDGMLIGYLWTGVVEEIVAIDPTSGESTVISILYGLNWVTTDGFAVDSVNHKAYLLGEEDIGSVPRIYSTDLLNGEFSSVSLPEDGSGGFGFDWWNIGDDIELPPPDVTWAGSGDYDGDGAADMTIYNETDGEWSIRAVRGTELANGMSFGAAGYEPVYGDFDGDGTTDLTLYQESSGYWYFLLSASSFSLASMQFGAEGYQPAPGDYDGDGKTDVAVYHETRGYWYIFMSDSGVLSSVKFGNMEYYPVPADYDGDGKADVAVYHEASGYWYVLLSGSWTLSYLKFGESGYTPVPGDYDGDGKTDVAVYHEASGYWYILMSSTYSLGYVQFGGPGYETVM